MLDRNTPSYGVRSPWEIEIDFGIAVDLHPRPACLTAVRLRCQWDKQQARWRLPQSSSCDGQVCSRVMVCSQMCHLRGFCWVF